MRVAIDAVRLLSWCDAEDGDFIGQLTAEEMPPIEATVFRTWRYNGLIFDPDPPEDIIRLPGLGGTSRAYSNRRLSKVRNVVNAAMRLLDVCPSAARCAQRSLHRVFVLQNEVLGGSSLSSSWPSRVGTAALTNCDARADACEWAADSLLHESIHSLLYRVERVDPFYERTEEVYRPSVVSPWTGRRLPLHSFVHACFVWFGLANLWHEIVRCQTPGSCDGLPAHYLRRAVKGFIGADLLDVAGQQRQFINSTACDQITTMQEIARKVC